MMRFLSRFFGLLLLAAAFILVVYDGMKSIAADALFTTSVRTLWEIVNAASLQQLRPTIERQVGPWLWDPVMVGFLSAPGWIALGILGIVLILLGRKKKPLIGYAR